MPKNEIYATVNVTQPAGLARVFLLNVKDKDGEAFTALGDGTFFGELKNVKTGQAVSFPVSVVAAEPNVLQMRFPALSAGRWQYEVYATAQGGGRDRLVCGVYSTLETVAKNDGQDTTTPYDAVLVLGRDREELTAYFTATTQAQMAANDAKKTLNSVQEDAALIRKAQQTIDELNGRVRDVFSIGPNGNWFVGGDDTGKPSRGEKGVDADDVQYHVIASAAFLPKDAAHCNGLHRYIVSAARLRYAAGYLPRGVTQLPAVSGVYLEGIEVLWSPNARGDKAENFCIAINGGTVEVGPDAQGIYRPIIYPGLGVGVRASVENGRVILSAELPGAAGNGKRVELTEEAGRLAGYDYTPVLSGGVDGVTYDVPEVQYLWTDKGWVAFPLVTPIHAGVDADGLVRLSTDAVVQNGIAIGRNAQGQIVADNSAVAYPFATTTQRGIAQFLDTDFNTHTTNTSLIPTPRAVTSVARRIAQEEIEGFKAAFKAELKSYFDGLYMAKDAIQVVDSRPAKPVAGRIYLVRE